MRFVTTNSVGAENEFHNADSGSASETWPLMAGSTLISARFLGQTRILCITPASPLLPFERLANRGELRLYCTALGRVISAVRVVSGGSVIVDSTKHPPYTSVLRSVPNLDLRFVHLLRDSRGVAYSEGKRDIVLPEFPHKADRGLMARSSPWRSGTQWMLKNTAFWLVTRTQPRRLVKYEHLMARPAEELDAIIRLVTTDGDSPVSISPPTETFESLPFHTVGGNPIRFNRGPIALQMDDEWMASMSRSDKAIVSALTFPLLFAYGYLGVNGHTPGVLGQSKGADASTWPSMEL